MNHWFDGLAMLHRFSFADGRSPTRTASSRAKAYRAAQETGGIAYSEFATDPCRSLFQRVTAMFSPKLTDNANVNLTKLGERFIAMTETPIPVQFDAETLGGGRRRLRRAGPADDRPSAPGPRDQGDAQLRGQARPAQQLPLLPAAPRTRRSPR